MSIAYAIMAGLLGGPKTGYDLNKSFQGSIGFFWEASHQHIYRELERLYKKGWVSLKVEPQQGKPARKVYALTPEGQQSLREWVETPLKGGPTQEPLLLKLYAAHVADFGKFAEEMEGRLAVKAAQMQAYKAVAQEHYPHPEQLTPQARVPYHTLRFGMMYTEAWMAWCQELVRDLRLAQAARKDGSPQD